MFCIVALRVVLSDARARIGRLLRIRVHTVPLAALSIQRLRHPLEYIHTGCVLRALLRICPLQCSVCYAYEMK